MMLNTWSSIRDTRLVRIKGLPKYTASLAILANMEKHIKQIADTITKLIEERLGIRCNDINHCRLDLDAQGFDDPSCGEFNTQRPWSNAPYALNDGTKARTRSP